MPATALRIAAAARGVLIEEGSAAVTMRRIAAAVAVTPMAIYRHYPDRDALLAAVADECFAELARDWAAHAGDGGVAGLDRLLSAHLDLALGRPHLYSFLFTEPRPGARRYPADFRAGGSPTLNVLATALEAGVRRGEIGTDDVWETALLLASQLHGLVQLYHGGRIGLSEDEFRSLCRRAVGRIVDGIRN
ncbi:TetR/AcrR family transcriptional regulator [Pseudonocardia cypriaca]|uniref:TetR family transcriptional regulator n=1 Tax=Pseudonocardia cypriaca TaxID=882449 RepID=A0A543GIU8_9PSEU|nr:TetR/AcrR family transcriptional regulator [Pseudonocardia cypriaca]TQM45954.1 TetR family transcriptional regulator [Pseudonocardia cypriaca]